MKATARKAYKLVAKYLTPYGQGDTLATQIATAVNRLVYKWYVDGVVYHGTIYMPGWENDISGAANWLAKYVDGAEAILDRIHECRTEEECESILDDIVVHCIKEDIFEAAVNAPAVGDVYNEQGAYKFEAVCDEDDEEA